MATIAREEAMGHAVLMEQVEFFNSLTTANRCASAWHRAESRVRHAPRGKQGAACLMRLEHEEAESPQLVVVGRRHRRLDGPVRPDLRRQTRRVDHRAPVIPVPHIFPDRSHVVGALIAAARSAAPLRRAAYTRRPIIRHASASP